MWMRARALPQAAGPLPGGLSTAHPGARAHGQPALWETRDAALSLSRAEATHSLTLFSPLKSFMN